MPDKSLFDRAKEALGLGADRGHDHDHDDEHEHEHSHEHESDDRISTEKAADDASPHRAEPLGGVGGAPEAAGWSGASGGATGMMGGAGAGGPTGATDPTLEGGDVTSGADPGAVKTEYEMGYEADPTLEPTAESGPGGGDEPEEHRSIVDDEER